MSERFVEWGVGSNGLMSPEFGGGWLEKAAVDEYLSETPQHIVLKCPFTAATSLVHTQAQVDAHERVVAWHVMALTAERDKLTDDLEAVKNGNGWWEVTPAGQKKRCSVNEEEELRIACEEATALKAENARLKAPVSEEEYECMFIALKAVSKNPATPIRGMEVFNAVLAARSNPPEPPLD